MKNPQKCCKGWQISMFDTSLKKTTVKTRHNNIYSKIAPNFIQNDPKMIPNEPKMTPS